MSKEINVLKLPFNIMHEAMKFDTDRDGKLTANAVDKDGKTINEIALFGEAMLQMKEESPKTAASIWSFNKPQPIDDYFAPKESEDVKYAMEVAKNVRAEAAKAKERAEVAGKMQEKWGKKFSASPLKGDFYEKVWVIMEELNIAVPEKSWNKERYASPEEQAFDEVIAIFAGEAGLVPSKKNGIYHGLFQANADCLSTIKDYAKKHPDEKGMSNIRQDMTTAKFLTLNGKDQLDYLIAFIKVTKGKDWSKIPEGESITPAQLWAMIKLPATGNNPKYINAKVKAINEIFKVNNIPRGIN